MFYRNQLLIILGIALFSVTRYSLGSETDEKIRELWEAPGRKTSSDAWKRTKAERERIIQEFKARLKKNDPHQVSSILIRLGDRETTKSMIQKMADGPRKSDVTGLFSSGSPLVIEYLIPYGKSDEPYKESGTDVIGVPFSFMVSSTIFGILSDSSAFDGETINWARRNANSDPVSKRAELQRWWEENKVHFEQENYKAVKPGREIPSIIEVVEENRRKVGLPSLTVLANEYRTKHGLPLVEEPEPTQPRETPVGVVSTSPTTANPPVAPSAVEADHQSRIWPWIAGASTFVVIAGALIRRRKRVTDDS